MRLRVCALLVSLLGLPACVSPQYIEAKPNYTGKYATLRVNQDAQGSLVPIELISINSQLVQANRKLRLSLDEHRFTARCQLGEKSTLTSASYPIRAAKVNQLRGIDNGQGECVLMMLYQ